MSYKDFLDQDMNYIGKKEEPQKETKKKKKVKIDTDLYTAHEGGLHIGKGVETPSAVNDKIAFYQRARQLTDYINNNSDTLSSAEANKLQYDFYNNERLAKEKKELEGANSFYDKVITKTSHILNSVLQKPQNFYDGYQFGDVTKTAGSTAIGAVEKVLMGAYSLGNFGKTAVADIGIEYAQKKGDKNLENRWKKALEDANKEEQEVKEKIYGFGNVGRNSIFGSGGATAFEGVGQSLILGGAGKVGGGILTFAQGYSAGIDEANKLDNVENWQKYSKAVASGGISWLTENITELAGYGAGVDDVVVNEIQKQVNSGIGKAIVKTTSKGVGEGLEEIIESTGNTLFNYTLNRVSEQLGSKAVFDENLDIEGMVEDAVTAFISAGFTEGASIYTQVEQNSKNVIKQIEETTGTKLTLEEKRLIKNEQLYNIMTQQENEIIIDNSSLTEKQKENLKQFSSDNLLSNKQVKQAIEMATRHNEQLTSQEYDFNNNIEVDVDNLNEINTRKDTLKSQIHSILEGETTITDLINNNENITDEQKQELLDLTKNSNNNLIDVLNQMYDYENVSNKVDINQNLDYNINQGNRDTSVQNITVAPYYNTPITNENFDEVKGQVETDFKNKAEIITNLFGGKVSGIQTNIGGYTFQEGETAGQMVNELSYTFELQDVDETQANLIASLMGDLGYEQQESVISSNYLGADSTEANSVETVINFKDINGVKEALEKVGITDYTIDTNNNQVKIYSDSLTDDIIASAKALSQELGGNYNGAEWNKTNSRFLDKETRGRIYQEWLENNSREQEGELYKNVAEAYKQLQGKLENKKELNNNGTNTNGIQIQKGINENQSETDFSNIYRAEEKRIREQGETSYTKSDEQFAKRLSNKYNKKVFIYNDSNTNFGGGLSTNNDNVIYFGRKALKDFGYDFLEGHEISEDMFRNHKNTTKPVYSKYITQIQEDKKFGDVFLKYINELSDEAYEYYKNKPELIAKEILCDLNGYRHSQTNIQDTIFRELNPELIENIQKDLETLENTIYAKNSQNEGSFSMQQDEEVFREETNKLLNNELPKTKPRQFPLSVQESDYVSDEVKKENSKKILKTETGQYTPIGNQETIDKANEKIQNSGADNVYTSFNTKFENNEKITLNDIAEAELLIQHYSETGDTEKAVKLIENVGILGTELGQQVQALSIIKKMTPQGQLAVANKLAERLSKKYDTDIEISKETQDLIKNSKMENIDDAMDKAYTEIADQLPLTIKERLDNLRFLAMLGNPKTHIRNMVGNTGNRVLTNVKNTVKGGIEDVIGMAWKDYQKNATIGIANKDQRTFAKLDAELLGEAIDDVGNKYNDNPNTEISKRKRHFDNKILNAMSKFNTELLNKEDVWALKGAYRDALQNYMLANNLSSEDLTVLETDSRETKKQKEEALRKAREYASQQAKEATFHQANEVATWLNNLKNSESLPRKNSRTFSRRNSSF